MSKVIGIDLGTTNSVVTVMELGSPKVITNEEGARTTPSIVAFTKKGDRLVGAAAKRQAVTNPTNTVYSVKRFIGMKYSEVKEEADKMPYTVRAAKSGMCEIVINNKPFAPPEVSAQILIKLKTAAENYLGEKISEAVITVPAYFNDSQRQATRDAGKIAGLEIKRIINEPTAAALAYGLDQKQDKKILVYDLGGGTFDVSILEIGDGVVEVLSTNGDTHLGGDDIDQMLVSWLVEEFKKENGIDLSEDVMVHQRLREAAEKAKIELSSTQQTDVNLPFITADNTGPKHLQISLTRSKFEQLINNIIQRTTAPIKNALSDAGLQEKDVDEVLMVGGSTRIPAVKKMVEKFFGKKLNSSVNPDEVVAFGAAVQGGVFTGEINDILLLDVTPLSLGLETMGGIMTRLIERNTTIPCSKTQTFTTAENNQPAVDIKVLQGEREFANDNKNLGTFKLDGIPAAPRGVPQIEVTFDIDANGIVSVMASDKATGKKQNIVIRDGGSLSSAEVEKMIREAQENEEEDKRKRKEIEVRNVLEAMIFQAEKTLEDTKDKVGLDSPSHTALLQAITGAKNVLGAQTNGTEVDSASATLVSAMQAYAQELYQQVEPHNSSDPAESPDDDDIIDADFVETPG